MRQYLMFNKQKASPLRYTTFSSANQYQRKSNFHSLLHVNEKNNIFNSTITKYRSIRQLKKREKQKKSKSQLNMYQYERSKQQNKCGFESLVKNNDVIEIIKLRLHENEGKNERIKTEYMMNRKEYKECMKKKKVIDFINNHSIDIIKNMFPKKLDLIINQLKLRRTQYKPSKLQNQIIVDLKFRPNSANNKVPIIENHSRTRIEQNCNKKSMALIQNKLAHERDEIKEVSGWDFDRLEEDLIFNGDQFKQKTVFAKLKR